MAIQNASDTQLHVLICYGLILSSFGYCKTLRRQKTLLQQNTLKDLPSTETEVKLPKTLHTKH